MTEWIHGLTVEKGYLGILRNVELKVDKSLSDFEVSKNLLEAGIFNANWNEEESYTEEFRVIEDFLFKNGLTKDTIRMNLGQFSYTYHFNHMSQIKSDPRQADLFLFIYKELGIATLLINFKLNHLSTDEIILFRKACEQDDGITIEKQNIMSGHEGVGFDAFQEILSKKIVKALIDKRKLQDNLFNRLKNFKIFSSNDPTAFEKFYENLVKVNSSIIEIRSISEFSRDRIIDSEFFETYSQAVYGIITTDEGWRYVPKNIVESVLNPRWGTRDFVSAIPFSYGMLLFNLKDSDVHQQYLAFQNEYRQFNTRYLNYFNFDYSIAGLDHGILFTVEKANALRILANKNMKSDYFSKNYSASRIIKNRKKMIETINFMAEKNIDEIDKLENLVYQKYYIDQYAQRVKERLELAENDTIIQYEIRTNRLMLLLTIIGLFMAVSSQWETIVGLWR